MESAILSTQVIAISSMQSDSKLGLCLMLKIFLILKIGQCSLHVRHFGNLKEPGEIKAWDSNASCWVLNWICLLEQIIWTCFCITWMLCGGNKYHRNIWEFSRKLLSLEILCTLQTLLKDKSCLPQVNRLLTGSLLYLTLCCHSVAWQKTAKDYNFPFTQNLKLWTLWTPVTQWLTLTSIIPWLDACNSLLEGLANC